MTVLGSIPVPEMESAIASVIIAPNQHPSAAGLGKTTSQAFSPTIALETQGEQFSATVSPVMALRARDSRRWFLVFRRVKS